MKELLKPTGFLSPIGYAITLLSTSALLMAILTVHENWWR